MKQTSARASQGPWWRFSRYEIENGYIRPAAHARIEHYDPWETFRDSRNLTVGQAPIANQPPYQSLMQLAQGLEYKPGPRRYPNCLTPASFGRITTWSQEHGPLGILLSRWEGITLAAVEREGGGFVQRRYLRAGGQEIQEFELSRDNGAGKGSVTIHELVDLTFCEEEPGKSWHRFFPSVTHGERNSFQYPAPYSDEFCELYAEHVGDFCRTALLISGAMLHLQASTQPAVANPSLAREQALQTINLIRRSVTSVLEVDARGRPRLVWESPSLMASFSEMYVQDLLFGRAALTCACCGAPFVSSAYQAQYCSVNCRYRGQKRRLRRQMKQAKALHEKGIKPAEIAATLGQGVRIVEGWLAGN